jgi:hypothetical protein
MSEPSNDHSSPSVAWLFLGIASAALAGYVAVQTIGAGAVNVGLVLTGVGAVLVPAASYVADRAGQRWGRPLAMVFGIALVGLAALAEWFFWIGDVQGTSYQKIDAALPFAGIGGLAAAGTGLLLTRGRGRVGVAAFAVAAILVPALLGQLTVWSAA